MLTFARFSSGHIGACTRYAPRSRIKEMSANVTHDGSLVEANLMVESCGLARGEQQRGTPVTRVSEMHEVRLAFWALIEQVRLVLRDGRRLIRRLIAVCDTSKRSTRASMTSGPAPLAVVPLVVLRATT